MITFILLDQSGGSHDPGDHSMIYIDFITVVGTLLDNVMIVVLA